MEERNVKVRLRAARDGGGECPSCGGEAAAKDVEICREHVYVTCKCVDCGTWWTDSYRHVATGVAAGFADRVA